MIVPAIAVEAIEGLEQRLAGFANPSAGNYRRFMDLDIFYVKTLLDYVKNATANEMWAVTGLLLRGKTHE